MAFTRRPGLQMLAVTLAAARSIFPELMGLVAELAARRGGPQRVSQDQSHYGDDHSQFQFRIHVFSD